MGDILTAKELASYLKLRESTVRNFAKRGDLPAIKIGRHWRFEMEKILMLFPEKKVEERHTLDLKSQPLESHARK